MEEKPKLSARIKGFAKEVQGEMKKVTWPTRADLYGATIVVVVVSVVMSMVLGGFDMVLGRLLQFVLALGS